MNINNYEEKENLFISNGFQVENNENIEIYLIFDGNECIGELTETNIGNNRNTSFMFENYQFISNALVQKYKLFFIYVDNKLICGYDNDYYDFYQNSHYDITDQIDTESINSNDIMLQSLVSYGSSINSSYGILNVPIVSNSSSPVSGKGLCWAASASSICAYRTSTTANTALQTYNIVKNLYSGNDPTSDQVTIVFNYYSLSYNYFGYGLGYTQSKAILQTNKPIYCGLKSSTTNNAHAVVICGYQEASGGYRYFRLMDPNNSNYVTIQVSLSSSNFTYGVYDQWKRTFY